MTNPTVKLSLVERTLNALGRCNRKRGGDILTRMTEEAAVLRQAFDEVRAEGAKPAGPCEHPWETGEGEPAECYECLVARAGRLERDRDELLGALRGLSALVERQMGEDIPSYARWKHKDYACAECVGREMAAEIPERCHGFRCQRHDALDVLARFGEGA